MNKEEISIFECDDQEFRKRIVESINRLIQRVDRHSRMIRELDDNILRVNHSVDDLESQVQILTIETDSLDDSLNELRECTD
jgi:phage shock protein A